MPRGSGSPTDVPGVTLGHASDAGERTGVSVVRFDRPAPTVVDVRGGAAATYDTASLSLDSTFGNRWAIFFAGGSLFGLDAGRGVRTRVLEEGLGHPVFGNRRRVAPISGAALYDLPRGPGALPDYTALGYAAAASASRRPPIGPRVGAGTGATVGKYRGRRHAVQGGAGIAAERVPRLGTVGVLAVLNSVGAIRDPETGAWRAGARRSRGTGVAPPRPAFRRAGTGASARGTNLVAVVTDASLSRPELARVAILAHSGVARAVVPVNSATDGDVVFVSSVGRIPSDVPRDAGARADAIGGAAAHAVVAAILAAVRSP